MTAVAVAIGGNGSKMAHFSHSARCAHLKGGGGGWSTPPPAPPLPPLQSPTPSTDASRGGVHTARAQCPIRKSGFP